MSVFRNITHIRVSVKDCPLHVIICIIVVAKQFHVGVTQAVVVVVLVDTVVAFASSSV